MNNIVENFIIGLSKHPRLNSDVFFAEQRKFAKSNNRGFFNKDELNKAYQKLLDKKTLKPNPTLLSLIRMKNTRSHSGIAVVSVLTKPYPCSGRCVYCPTQKDVPKSYLSNEPAVMRAISCKYHPYRQTESRLSALEATGHIIDKISIRIIGGTWSEYPKRYQSWFISQVFRACNEYYSKEKLSLSLPHNQKVNESANVRIVELSIETRQDRINYQEVIRLRNLGVTKVELGVQSVDDNILQMNSRGSSNADTVRATKLLKDYGFKVSYQMMLNLLGANPASDINVFKTIFSQQDYRPDHLKIYPLALVKNSKLYKHYVNGNFQPYDRNTLIKTISTIKSIVPEYCRIERVIRDIPAEVIVKGGAKSSNLRQEVQQKMKRLAISCRCIRCREIKDQTPLGIDRLYINEYLASDSQEYFISIESGTNTKQLRGFLRLRKVNENTNMLVGACYMVRELHVYGPTVAIGETDALASQHKGIGKRLVTVAEQIALEDGAKKICVIAGIGVRKYFKKLGYKLVNTYMTKDLKPDT
ncbi:MAG: coproporphyrinogen III oxidase [bacterium ADurb.Bin212]|nr:MAG: coproporphyrinogen III oxidase [bacterium ADurb.Bin212]